MHKILIMGAGKIGTLIAFLLSQSKKYEVHLADIAEENPQLHQIMAETPIKLVKLDATDTQGIIDYIKKHQIKNLVSSLPYYCNIPIAIIAAQEKLNYFDLTEDVETTSAVQELAKNAVSAFVPQCGLAPGFISIITNDLMQRFESLYTVKMRVGALPINTSNALQYSLTWSTDGLINEYGNLCNAIQNGQSVNLLPLEGLEEIKIDGLTYEAFNTSGGVGTLAESYKNKVRNLSYKTIRYPGHCEKIKFLMNGLKLNHDRETLKRIFESAIPKTFQDVVLVYVSVTGIQNDQLIEENYVRKFYPKVIGKITWSAIQLTTASGITAVIDIVLNNPEKYHGFITQERFSFQELIETEFGNYYK